MQFTIREFCAADAAELHRIYRAAVERLGARDYSPAQVRAWSGVAPHPDEFVRRYGDGRHALVAVDTTDRPLGFSDVEHDGHIDLLYVAPDAAGNGIASALLQQLERHARARGLDRLFAEASETALAAFVRNGFVRTARRDLTLGGVPIHNHAVEKALNSP